MMMLAAIIQQITVGFLDRPPTTMKMAVKMPEKTPMTMKMALPTALMIAPLIQARQVGLLVRSATMMEMVAKIPEKISMMIMMEFVILAAPVVTAKGVVVWAQKLDKMIVQPTPLLRAI